MCAAPELHTLATPRQGAVDRCGPPPRARALSLRADDRAGHRALGTRKRARTGRSGHDAVFGTSRSSPPSRARRSCCASRSRYRSHRNRTRRARFGDCGGPPVLLACPSAVSLALVVIGIAVGLVVWSSCTSSKQRVSASRDGDHLFGGIMIRPRPAGAHRRALGVQQRPRAGSRALRRTRPRGG